MIVKLAGRNLKQFLRPLQRNKTVAKAGILGGITYGALGGAAIGNASNAKLDKYNNIKRDSKGNIERKPGTSTTKRVLTGILSGAILGGGIGLGASHYIASDLDNTKKEFTKFTKQFKRFGRDFTSSRPKRFGESEIKSFFTKHTGKSHTSIRTKAEASKVYRNLAKIHHPDAGGDSKLFQQITSDWNEVKNSDWFEKLAFFISKRK